MTAIKEPDAMREVHETRERLYEQQKGWNDEQHLEHLRKITKEAATQYGLEIAPPPEPKRTSKTG